MYGKQVSLQFFEVKGKPRIHQNGSDSTEQAFHGFPHNRYWYKIPHTRDDYYVGESYHSIAIIRGFRFPSRSDFGFSDSVLQIDAHHHLLKGVFLRFELPDNIRIKFQKGKQYAFLAMIDSLGAQQGFTLANRFNGNYPDGHAIRREGSGIFPPPPAYPLLPFDHLHNQPSYLSSRLPSDFKIRTQQSPSTNGYPDVDTWARFGLLYPN